MRAIEKIKMEIAKRIEKVGVRGGERLIEYSSFGDLTVKLFPLAKMKGKSFEEIAKELDVESIEGIERKEVKGGYLNIWVRDDVILDSLEWENEKREEKVIVEFPSVNPNKPWHIGHLRNALIGESLARIYEEMGYKVERIDYINDLGLQVAESYYYFKRHGSKCNEKFDHCIGKDYVKAHKLVEENKEVEGEVRALLKQIEEGDEEARAFAEEVVKAQYKTAEAYRVCHDALIFESDLARLVEEGIKRLMESKAVEYVKEGKNKGCYVMRVNVEGEEREKVLIRSDSTATYTGKDIIFHLWKLSRIDAIRYAPFIESCGKVAYKSAKEGEAMEFGNADLAINIIGIEQSYPQAVVKEAIEKLLGKAPIVHVAYAFVRLKESRFSGRKGTWVGYTADELLEEGIKRVMEKTKDRGRAEKIALAAIKFGFLRVNPKKEIVFDWDRALSVEGDSGVYLLYSYVRASSIMKKAGKKGKKGLAKEGRELALTMVKLKDAVREAARRYDPSIIADYLLQLSKLFHSFYSKVRVIGSKDEEELLYIVDKYREVMMKGLYLLGIDVVEEM